jgi:hypothetical protein
MNVFYASTQAFYERDGLRRVIPCVLLLRAESRELANEMASEYLDEHFPSPGYFDHAFDVEPVEGIDFAEGDDGADLIVLSVAEEFILHTPPKG